MNGMTGVAHIAGQGVAVRYAQRHVPAAVAAEIHEFEYDV
jgi:hypothetical protein